MSCCGGPEYTAAVPRPRRRRGASGQRPRRLPGGAQRDVLVRLGHLDGTPKMPGARRRAASTGPAAGQQHPAQLDALRGDQVGGLGQRGQHRLDRGPGQVGLGRVAGGQAAQHAGGRRPVRGPLAVQVGQQGQAARAGLGGQRPPDSPATSVPSSVAVASSTRPALTVQTRGRNRPVASAKPATAPGRRRPGGGDRERGARGADGHGQLAGLQAEARARRPCCRPCPGPARRRRRSRPTISAGRATRGSAGSWPSAAAATSGSQRPGRGEVAGAGRVAAVGDRVGGAAAREGASREVSQSCGSSTRADPAALSGSWSASQRSLVTVNEALGHAAQVCWPTRRGRRARRSARRRHGPSAGHSTAARAGSPRPPRPARPCRAAGRPRRSRRPGPAGRARPAAARPTTPPGRTRCPRVRRAAPADDRAVLGLAQHDLGGLRR